jgi:hypothetical protein
MFIPSKTAFNVYSKFTTLRKQPSIAPLFPPIVHSYYDQTEVKLNSTWSLNFTTIQEEEGYRT